MTKAVKNKGVELTWIQSAMLESIEIAKIRGEMEKRCKERTGFKLKGSSSPQSVPQGLIRYANQSTTAEMISARAATGITSLSSKRIFFPHRATISTEIGERFPVCITFPPIEKD